MKKFAKFLQIALGVLFLSGLNTTSVYAASCGGMGGTAYCDPQATGLTTTTYSEVTFATPNPCCLNDCLPNAKHNGLVCTCDNNYYKNGNQCNTCASLGNGTWNKSTFPTTGSDTDCYTECENQDIRIGNTSVGTREFIQPQKRNYPDTCQYTTSCNANYFISGEHNETCEACPTSHPYSSATDNATKQKCYKNCGGTTNITCAGGVQCGSVTCPNGTANFNNACSGCTVSCKAGYRVNGDTCNICPADTYKAGENNLTSCTSCDTAGGYSTSGATGQTSEGACKKTCQPDTTRVPNGTWQPDSGTVSQPAQCSYTNEANLSCNPGYEMTGSGASATCVGKTYTLKFDKNHNDASGNQADITTCKFGSPCNWTNSFVNPGYNLDGWATSAGAAATITGNSYTLSGTFPAGPNPSVTLYAKWTACTNTNKDKATAWTPRTCVITSCSSGYGVTGTGNATACTGQNYTITFNSGGGSGTQAAKTCRYGDACTWTNTITRNGYNFDGWAVTSPANAGTTGGTLPNNGSYTPTTYHSAVTLTAQWTECANAGKQFALTWTPRTCEILTCQTGYQKNGTGTNTSCGGRAYQIEFMGNGSTAGTMANANCVWGQECTWTENTYGKTSSVFDGWALSGSGTVVTTSPHLAYSPTSYPSSGTLRLYAKWTTCNNTGADHGNAWDPGCVIISCKVGYYWYIDDSNKTACGPCTDNAEGGRYCPGFNCNGTQCTCEPGFYCPGYTVNRPSNCVSADETYIGRCKCPIGATSEPTSSSVTECVIPGGQTGTRFCDSDGCFYLNNNITYYAS